MQPLTLAGALQACRQAKAGHEHRLALITSYEPLHLKTFLEAYLAVAVPGSVPRVLTFGFDGLREGLKHTSSVGSHEPALLALDWADIHPVLSWRTRSWFACEPREVEHSFQNLLLMLEEWIAQRDPNITYAVLPPSSWLPLLDSTPSPYTGPVRACAEQAVATVAELLTRHGVRVLSAGDAEIDFRGLLSAGSPLTVAAAERIARTVVETMCFARSRVKAVVVDLDNTLWKGVIGEDGRQNIRCAPEGEGYPFFIWQKFLKKLRDEGVLLGFCSKNNESDVLPVFDELNLPLKLADFSSYRCNWDSKPQNLREIVAEMNIGSDAVLYVDDNPAELEQIRAAFPELRAMRTPESSAGWLALFRELHELTATFQVTAEDRLRTEAIRSQTVRVRAASGSEGVAYLKELGLELEISFDGFAPSRSLQLINKTNQFNLTGERISEAVWGELSRQSYYHCCTASLKDKYGEFGIIAVLLGQVSGQRLTVESMVLSCRAFGRCVEHLFLSAAARAFSATSIEGRFLRTEKNEPAERFLRGLEVAWPSESGWQFAADRLHEIADGLRQEAGIRVKFGARSSAAGEMHD